VGSLVMRRVRDGLLLLCESRFSFWTHTEVLGDAILLSSFLEWGGWDIGKMANVTIGLVVQMRSLGIRIWIMGLLFVSRV